MSTESARVWRKNNPVRYAFNNLKGSAKRRGKYFDLTLQQFIRFCVKYQYIKKKGKTIDSFTVDCIEADKGYTYSNIQSLRLQDNARKKRLDYDWQYKTASVSDCIISSVIDF